MLKPPQRWALIAAWVSALSGLGPVIWRVHMLVWGAGWDMAPSYRGDPMLIGYVLGLCVIETATSLAVFGLVRPWGETWPRLLPRIGGRRIPCRFVLSVAVLGATAVTIILAVIGYAIIMRTARGISNPVLQVHGWQRGFLLAHYLPWPLWPLGLWIAIIGYARRWGPARPGMPRPRSTTAGG